MRKAFLCLLGCCLLSNFSYAQVVSDDFEGNGTITSWAGDDCGMDNAFVNPFAQGINTSATVLEYTDTGGLYANVRFDVPTNFDLSAQPSFSLKIYVPSNGLTGSQPNQISLKLQDGNLGAPWSTQSEVVKSVNLNQWQTVTFDFANDPFINLDPNSPAPTTRTDFNRVLLQVNGENNNDQVVAYIDDFVYNGTLQGGGGGSTVFNQLVWADEFNGTGAVDPAKWHHQTQLPNGFSWYNNEIQHYTNRLDNSYMDGGNLYIVAKKETFTDQGHTKQYTSARLNSKFAFTYGRVEVRAMLPTGVGTWPAIWTLGKNIQEPGGYWTPTHGSVGWPACGEIDIMEHWGYNQNYISSALHTPSSSGSTVNVGGVMVNSVSNTFHIYAMEWDANEIRFSVDGNVHYTYAPVPQDPSTWPFTADQYILLNIAIEASIDPNFTESPMVIDYVRVYEEGVATATEESVKPKVLVYPNPIQDELNLELPEGLRNASIRIFSPQGKLLRSWYEEGAKLKMDWSNYPPGLYVILLKNGDEEVAYKVLKL